ncbi:MAG: ATP-dependent DNA helicase [Acidobacteriota bacterium]
MEEQQPQQAEILDKIFGPDGWLAAGLADYEFRPAQLEMARAVLRAVAERRVLCVEAGTGTGKTLAYLVPSLLSRRRVLVATATLALQDQILLKDLPFLQKLLFPEIRTCAMKGRQNYLCLRRLERARQTFLPGTQEAAVLRRWTRWAAKSETGDRSELADLADDDPLWGAVDARSDTCIGQKCAFFEECFVTRLRRRAAEADVVVVNHALYFSHLALERDEIGRILPECGVTVLDEAHEVEDTAAEYFGRRLSSYQLEDLIRTLRRVLPPDDSGHRYVTRLETCLQGFLREFPREVGRFSLVYYGEAGRPPVDLREKVGAQARDLLHALHLLFAELEGADKAGEETEALLRRIDQYYEILEEIFESERPEFVYWFERTERALVLYMTPVDVSGIMREKVFLPNRPVILTSATLAVGGSFAYLRGRLGIAEADELIVPPEFDYARQAVLYVPRHLPDPREPGYREGLWTEIQRLLGLSDGHAFLLFTSVQQMRWVYEKLVGSAEYPVLCQGTAPKHRLLAEFRRTPRAVLCATASFWQGIDVKGPALRAVIIDKLPFQVPSEPLVKARCERLREEGRNPFWEYSLPAAVIILRQGLGRLIRSKKDTGFLAVLDSRLWTKRYGKVFLQSLPTCPVVDNISDLENLYSRIASAPLGEVSGGGDDAPEVVG